MMNVNNEAVLVDFIKKAQRGNEVALKWLYNSYAKTMFNICIRMAGNREDANDLMQNSFITAFSNIEQLKEPKKFGGWLKKIVIHECIHFCKAQIKLNSWMEHEIPDIPDDETDWWVDFNFELIHSTIKTLPDKCRVIFNLYVLEDYSHKQIADTLGITEGTSKSQYFRAKELIREKLGTKLQYNG